MQNALTDRLRAGGHKVVSTREPGGTPLAEAVRNLTLHPPEGSWSPLAEALLMNAARNDHVEKVIKPALARGSWVICDRFSDSTLAYQSAGGDMKLKDLRRLEKIVLGKTKPDLTLILDAPVGQLRVRRGSESDAFEDRGLTFHHAVREAFLEIAEEDPHRCTVINALLPEHEVLSAALNAIKSRLKSAEAA